MSSQSYEQLLEEAIENADSSTAFWLAVLGYRPRPGRSSASAGDGTPGLSSADVNRWKQHPVDARTHDEVVAAIDRVRSIRSLQEIVRRLGDALIEIPPIQGAIGRKLTELTGAAEPAGSVDATESTGTTPNAPLEGELRTESARIEHSATQDIAPVTKEERQAKAEDFYREYGQHLKRIGAYVEGSNTDAVSRLMQSVAALYGGPAHFLKRMPEQGPITVGFAGGKDSSSIFQLLRWLQLHMRKVHGETFSLRSETMLQGGLPPSSLRVIDQIFRDSGAIGNPSAELIVTSGRRMYDYREINKVMNEVRQRDSEGIAVRGSMAYGMKPRATFCDVCNSMMLNANKMVISPRTGDLKPAVAMVTGDSLEEVGLYLPWPVRVARSPTFNREQPLRNKIGDIRDGYSGYQNLVLAVADVMMNFYHPKDSDAATLYDFEPHTGSRHPVEWFQVYGQGFAYDAGVNKPRLDKYFDFRKENLALALTESDCFHPLLGLVWQARSMARLSQQGKLGAGVRMTEIEALEALLKQHYVPLMFEKKIPPFLIELNLDRFFPDTVTARVHKLIGARPEPNAMFNADEVRRLTEIVDASPLDASKTRQSIDLVNGMARQIYGYTPENVQFILASPVANHGENLRGYLAERFSQVRPAQRAALEQRVREVLENKRSDPVVERWLESLSAIKLPQLRHSYLQPLASPITGSSKDDVMRKLRQSTHYQDVLRVEDPYKRAIDISPFARGNGDPAKPADPVWLFIEGR